MYGVYGTYFFEEEAQTVAVNSTMYVKKCFQTKTHQTWKLESLVSAGWVHSQNINGCVDRTISWELDLFI